MSTANSTLDPSQQGQREQRGPHDEPQQQHAQQGPQHEQQQGSGQQNQQNQQNRQEQQNQQQQQQQGQQQEQHASGLYPNHPGFKPEQQVVVGGEILCSDPIEYNTGRKTVKLTVRNTGDRPIQVGSHFHFFEVNRYLEFDRDAAFGCHLNIPATTAIRFEPGDQKEVEVVAYSGKRRVIGFNGLVMGYTGDEDAPTYFPAHMHALRKARHAGFKTVSKQEVEAAEKQSDNTKN